MESNLTVKGTQTFMGLDIPIIEGGFGEGQKVALEKHIAEIHNIPVREVRKSILRLIEKQRLRESVDYIDILQRGKEFTTFDLTDFYAKAALAQVQNIFVLSERGYSKLIKAMDDDTSWDIMDKFIDEYFRFREQLKISERDRALLKIAHAKSDVELMLACRSFEEAVEKPLIETIDRYERFLCNKLEVLTKTQLAAKLDTAPQTLAVVLKREGVYTPKGSRVSVDFLNRYPNIKMIKETVNTYENPKTQTVVEERDWQWTYEGAKTVVDFLIEKGHVIFCDNDGFKLIKN